MTLENIYFSLINTCNSTAERTNHTLLPFSSLTAKNITFQNNDFCDISMFSNEDSSFESTDLSSIHLDDIKILENRFSSYEDISGVLL